MCDQCLGPLCSGIAQLFGSVMGKMSTRPTHFSRYKRPRKRDECAVLSTLFLCGMATSAQLTLHCYLPTVDALASKPYVENVTNVGMNTSILSL